ncbi:hypothetical protein ABR233_000103 [Escherichia coli]
MESNIKGLVAAGHEMASELKAECGAVDMRSVAKLISDLATQLEVQLVRANALAAENAGLKSFGDKLNEMHNDLNGEGTGIQGRAEVACQQVALEAAMEEFDAIKTPATDAFLDEVRAQGVEMAACALDDVNQFNYANMLDDLAQKLRQEAVQ